MNARSIPEIRKKIVNNHQIYSLGNKHHSSNMYAICSPKNEWGFWYEQGEDWTEIDVESYYNAKGGRGYFKFPHRFSMEAEKVTKKSEMKKILVRIQKMLDRDLLHYTSGYSKPKRKTKDTLEPGYWNSGLEDELSGGMAGISEVLRLVNFMLNAI